MKLCKVIIKLYVATQQSHTNYIPATITNVTVTQAVKIDETLAIVELRVCSEALSLSTTLTTGNGMIMMYGKTATCTFSIQLNQISKTIAECTHICSIANLCTGCIVITVSLAMILTMASANLNRNSLSETQQSKWLLCRHN